MKVLITFLCLAALATSAILPASSRRLGNELDDLVKEALETVRGLLQKSQEFKVPDFPPITINDDENKVYLTVHLTDVMVSKAADFVVNDVENDLIALTAKFGMTFPSPHIAGKFTVSGTALGKKVSGDGTFSLDVSQLVSNGNAQLEYQGQYLHMKSNHLSYTIQGLKFTEQGLVVEGVTEQEIEDFVNTKLLKFLQDNEPMLSQKIADQAMVQENALLQGKTLQDIINLLKQFIKDPTDFPPLNDEM